MGSFAPGDIGGMVFNCCSRRTFAQLEDELARQGFKTYALDGSGMWDKASLYAAFRSSVPLGDCQPTEFPVWDAFMDCLWQGLQGEPDEKVAILWSEADRLLEGKLPLLLQSVECISGAAESLLGTEHGNTHSVILRVFLIGEGPNFPDFGGGE